jgi:hypothetical protein
MVAGACRRVSIEFAPGSGHIVSDEIENGAGEAGDTGEVPARHDTPLPQGGVVGRTVELSIGEDRTVKMEGLNRPAVGQLSVIESRHTNG